MFFNLRYPVKYKNEIKECSIEAKVDESLIFAVINAESSFNSRAVSKVGAVGLMQIMPTTANYVCEMYNLEPISSKEDLFNEKLNIRIGTFYINYLLKKFNGNLKYTLVAYNAGENKVQEWLKSNNFDLVAYPSSLNYYKKVVKYRKVYSKII